MMQGQISPQFADTRCRHEFLNGQVTKNVQQAVIRVTDEIVKMFREKEPESFFFGSKRVHSTGCR
jgi:hypothetical protein